MHRETGSLSRALGRALQKTEVGGRVQGDIFVVTNGQYRMYTRWLKNNPPPLSTFAHQSGKTWHILLDCALTIRLAMLIELSASRWCTRRQRKPFNIVHLSKVQLHFQIRVESGFSHCASAIPGIFHSDSDTGLSSFSLNQLQSHACC